MSHRLPAELIDKRSNVVLRATATIWMRATRGGLMDWGGSLDASDTPPPIAPGAYSIRFGDGRVAEVIVNNVRVRASNGRGITSSVTFLGDGELPPVPTPTH